MMVAEVGVYQNDLQTLLAQCAARLRACIVELGSLTDNDRAGAQYHYLMNILAQQPSERLLSTFQCFR